MQSPISSKKTSTISAQKTSTCIDDKTSLDRYIESIQTAIKKGTFKVDPTEIQSHRNIYDKLKKTEDHQDLKAALGQAINNCHRGMIFETIDSRYPTLSAEDKEAIRAVITEHPHLLISEVDKNRFQNTLTNKTALCVSLTKLDLLCPKHPLISAFSLENFKDFYTNSDEFHIKRVLTRIEATPSELQRATLNSDIDTDILRLRHICNIEIKKATSQINPQASPPSNAGTILAHFFGNAFAKTSYLEGSNSAIFISFLSDALKRNITNPALVPYSSHLSSIQIALDRGLDIDPTKNIGDLPLKLTSMSPNETMILPFGWTGDKGSSGHATYLEITKNDDHTVTVKHFNLGSGCDLYQDSLYNEHLQQACFFPYTLQENIPLTAFNNPVFLKGFQELHAQQAAPRNLEAKDVYSLLSLLGPMSKPPAPDISDYQTPQHSGLCAWLSLNTLLKSACAEKEYAQVYRVLGLDLLHDFETYLLSQNNPPSLADSHIFTLCIDSFLQETAGYADHYTTDEKADIVALQQLKDLHTQNMQQISEHTVVELSATAKRHTPAHVTAKSTLAISPLRNTPEVSFERALIDVPTLRTPEAVAVFLESVYTECKATFESEKTQAGYERVVLLSNQALQHLPLPDDSLWNSVTSPQIIESCNKLTDLSTRCFALGKTFKVDKYLQLDTAIAHNQAFAVTLRLLKNNATTLIESSDTKKHALGTWLKEMYMPGYTFPAIKNIVSALESYGNSPLAGSGQREKIAALMAFHHTVSAPQNGKPGYTDLNTMLLDPDKIKNNPTTNGREDPLIAMLHHHSKKPTVDAVRANPALVTGLFESPAMRQYIERKVPTDTDDEILSLIDVAYDKNDRIINSNGQWSLCIPKEFKSIIGQLFQITFIEEGGFIRKDTVYDDASSIDLTQPFIRFEIATQNTDITSKHQLTCNLLNSTLAIPARNIGPYKDEEENIDQDFPDTFRKEYGQFHATSSTLQDPVLRGIVDSSTDPYISTDIEDMAFKTPYLKEVKGSTDSHHTLQEIKDLSKIVSKEGNTGLKLVKLLTYFTENKEHLIAHSHKKDYQDFFKQVLLSEALNQDTLGRYTQLGDMITEFLTMGFQESRQSGNHDAASFFVKMMVLTESRLQVDFRCNEAIQTLLHQNPSPEEFLFLHQLRMAYYGQHLAQLVPNEIATEYLASLVAIGATPDGDHSCDTEIRHLCKQSILKLTPLMAKYFQENDDAMQLCLQTLTESKETWKCSAPGIYTDGSVVVSLHTGELTRDGAKTGVPAELLMDPSFLAIFPRETHAMLAIRKDGNGYECAWHGRPLRFQKNEQNTFTALLNDEAKDMEMFSDWHQLIPRENIKSTFQDSFGSKRLMYENFVFVKQDRLLLYLKTLSEDVRNKLPAPGALPKKLEQKRITDHIKNAIPGRNTPPSEALTQDFLKKVQALQNGIQQQPNVLFLDQISGTCSATCSATQTGGDITFETLQNLNGQAYLDISDTPLQVLTRISDSFSIECLGDPISKECDDIRLLDLGLRFTRNAQNSFVCDEPSALQGYWIDPNQYARGLHGFDGYLRLKNGTQSILLIPTKRLTPKAYGSRANFIGHEEQSEKADKKKKEKLKFGSQYQLDHDKNIDPKLPPFFVFDSQLLPQHSTTAKPVRPTDTNRETNLLLIHLLANIEQYQQAFQMIESTFTTPLATTDTDLGIIKATLASIAITDPRGAAVFLKFTIKLLERCPHSDIQKLVTEKIKPALSTYLTLRHHRNHCDLSQEDERTLLHFYKNDPKNKDSTLPIEIERHMERLGIPVTRDHDDYTDTPIFTSPFSPKKQLQSEVFEADMQGFFRDVQTHKIALQDYRSPAATALQKSPESVLRSNPHSVLWCYHTFKHGTEVDKAYAKALLAMFKNEKPKDTFVHILDALSKTPDEFMSFDDFIQNLSGFEHNPDPDYDNFRTQMNDAIKKAYPQTINNEISHTKKQRPTQNIDHTTKTRPVTGTPLSQPEVNAYKFPLPKSMLKSLLLLANEIVPPTTSDIPRPEIVTAGLLKTKLNALYQDLEDFESSQTEKATTLQGNIGLFLTTAPTQDTGTPSAEILIEKIKTSCTVAQNLFEKQKLSYALMACEQAMSPGGSPPLGAKRKITIDDLSVAFLSQNSAAYKALNPNLTDADCATLHTHMFHYLQNSRKSQQVQRTEKLIAAIGETPTAENIRDLFAELNISVEATNGIPKIKYLEQYDLTRHPEMMVFEHKTGFGIRPDQVRNLQLLYGVEGQTHPNETILQMIMGSGKSKLLLPLLAYKKADGEHLSTVVVPDALLTDVVGDLHVQSSDVFGQKPFLFQFDRQTSLSHDELDGVMHQLESTITKRNYVITTSKSMHCLRLKYIETLKRYHEETSSHPYSPECKNLFASATKLQSLLTLFSEKARVTIDEADAILSCKNEVNFTIGHSVKPTADQTHMLVDLHRHIGRIKAETKTPLTKDNFQTTIKHAILEKLKSSPNCLGPDISALVARESKAVMAFLEKDTGLPEGRFSDKERNLLYLLRQELNELLSITYQRENFVSYGPSTEKKEVQAIPYVGNNTPSKTSRFDQIHEILNYTIQMYQGMEMPAWILSEHVTQLQNDAKKESGKGIPFSQTPSGQTFASFFPGIDIEHLKNDRNIPAIVSDIQTKLKEDPELLDAYLKGHLLNAIGTNDTTLNSNSFDLVDMFQEVQGFTGTPWNSDTFHHRLTTQAAQGTDGESMSLLLNREVPVDLLPQTASIPDMIDTLKIEPNTRAFIDCGAIFKGQSNRAIATQLLTHVQKKNNTIQAIVFYENNEKKVLDMDGRTTPFGNLDVPEDNRFTYYDHIHTTGCDIAQSDSAHAITSIGANLKIRDLFQGIWRMRGLAKGQSISLVIPPEVAAGIRPDGSTPTVADILTFLAKNQTDQLENQLIQSFQTQFSHVYRSHAYRAMLGDISQIPPEAIAQFMTHKTINPAEMYQYTKTEVPREAAIANFETNATTRFQEKIPDAAKVQIASLREKSQQSLPETIVLPSFSAETENEIEAEVETETEQESMVFTNYRAPRKEALCAYTDLTNPLTLKNKTSPLNQVIPFFSENLRIAPNLMSEKLRGFFSAPVAAGISPQPVIKTEYQLNCDFVLVTQSDTDHPTISMLHEHDVQRLMDTYESDITNSEAPHIMIVSVATGQHIHTNKAASQIKISDPIKTALLQIKLFNGEMIYSEDEYRLLQQWITPQNKQEILTFMQQNHPTQQKAFEKTPLFRLLNT